MVMNTNLLILIILMKKTRYLLLLLSGLPLGILAQNTCMTASNITAGTYSVAAVNGSEYPANICASGGSSGITAAEWYKYTPSVNYTVTISTDLAASVGVDTRVSVYTGTCGNLTCVGGDDDAGSGNTSLFSFPATAGTQYIIVFDNKWSSAAFDFQLSEGPYVEPITPPVTFTQSNEAAVSGTYQLAVTDMNGDYLDDIVSISSGSIQILYQQSAGGFNPVTITTAATQFLPSWSMAIGDFDKNGFNDLLYGDGSGVTFMRANATGTAYSEISGSEYIFSQRSNFADINNDGHLDAFVCHDVDPNVYYLNDGTGNLVYHQGGIGDHSEGGNYGSLWVDYDNDGDQDCFIAKCRGGQSTAKINELHQNDGSGNFTNVALAANMADSVQTWSSAWNDYDNDGWMDAVVGASSTTDGSHKVMKNNGDGTFSDITTGSGWDVNPNLNIEHISYDFDNDGFADVFGGGNKIMFNNGDLTFSPSPYSFTNGSIGDLNNDGFLDIRNGSNIFYNSGNSNNWIKIQLQGIASNSNGIGARVEIYGAWGKQIRDVRSGDGFRYMNTLNVHFGIGAATAIDSIYIKWPSGQIDHIINPAINTPLTVVEGSSPLSLLTVNGQKITLYPNPATESIHLENSDQLSLSKATIYQLNGQEVQSFTSGFATIYVESLEKGAYFLLLETTDGKKYSQSFVKQ